MRKTHIFIYANILLTLFFFDLKPLSAAPLRYQNKTEPSLQVKHPSLKAVIGKLKKFPESNRVIKDALKDGSITVDTTYKEMPFEAMWNCAMRKIVIDSRTLNDQGKVLRHLLFELTNAVAESKYQELYKMAANGRIDCDSYVEAVEIIEHENMVHTANIIEKGIARGIYHPSARWTIIYDFAIHYKIQQLTGHSILIAKEYLDLTRGKGFSTYRGTVKNLKKMSQREKMSQLDFLHSEYFGSR